MLSAASRFFAMGMALGLAPLAASSGCAFDFGQFHDDAAGGASVASSDVVATGVGATTSASPSSASATTVTGSAESASSAATTDAASSSSTGGGPVLDRCSSFSDDFNTFSPPTQTNGWDLRGASSDAGGAAIDPTTSALFDIGHMNRPATVVDPCFASVDLVTLGTDSTQYLGMGVPTDASVFVDVEYKGGIVTYKNQAGLNDITQTGTKNIADVTKLGFLVDGPQIVLYAFAGSWHFVGAVTRPAWSNDPHYVGFGAYNPYFQDSTHTVFDNFNTPQVSASELPPS